MSLGKVCEGRLRLWKEKSKLVDRGKWLKETQLGVGLVSNSSFLNGDVGITWLVISIFSKKIFVSLSYLPFAVFSSYICASMLDIVYIYLYVSLEPHCIYTL
jgi:hypothetical protein